MNNWNCLLTLDSGQNIVSGSPESLREAIGKAGDLRIHTDFRHNEHIDTASDNRELVNEVSEFHETVLLENRWSAGFMTTRQPVSLPDSFGIPSISFFLYNQDGNQAIARPILDGKQRNGETGPSPLGDYSDMPKYHEFSSFDAGTSAPNSNFIYDFELIRYFIRDNWQEVLEQDEQGNTVSGSMESLSRAFLEGCEVKVGVKGLFNDLTDVSGGIIEHEVFIQTGWCYHYSAQKLFIAATHPLVRVRPNIPLQYSSGAWDFGWLLIRTDGYGKLRICNPYTLQFTDTAGTYPVRWFVR